MRPSAFALALAGSGPVAAVCPFAGGAITTRDDPDLLLRFQVSDDDEYLTTDAGGPVND